MPAGDPWQVSVDVPEPPALDRGERVQARLVELVLTLSVTVPLNPLTGATVIVELPAEPAFMARLVGFSVIVKSGEPLTENTTVVV